MRITPMKIGKYYEPCMIEMLSEQKDADWYPSAFVHIDSFWQGHGAPNEVHNALNTGKVVIISVSLDMFEVQP